MKKWFESERIFRLFVFLQIIGIISVVFYDMNFYKWDILPDNRGWAWYQFWEFHWAFFETRFWTKYGNFSNWVALGLIFGPIFISKSLDWIIQGGASEK
nr:hypothetical protein [Desulfobacula sp.]